MMTLFFNGLLEFVHLSFEFVNANVFCFYDVKELRDAFVVFFFKGRIRTRNPEIV